MPKVQWMTVLHPLLFLHYSEGREENVAKFCGKCGSKLDESIGLCLNCDADKLNKQTETPEAVEKPRPKQDTAFGATANADNSINNQRRRVSL